jgi:hypothetical protein
MNIVIGMLAGVGAVTVICLALLAWAMALSGGDRGQR